MLEKKRTATFYLTGWQKRMINDCIKLSDFNIKSLERLTKVMVSIEDRKQWVMYRQVPDYVKTKQWHLYLTDEQIVQAVEIFGLKAGVSALNISPELVESGELAFG